MSGSQTIRYAIVDRNKTRIVDVQLDHNADLKITDDLGNTLLHLALKNEELNETPVIQIFEILLDRGLDINAKNRVGKTVMHLAIERRNREVIDFCIRRNTNLHITDLSGNTFAQFVIEEEHRRFCLIDKNQNLVELENESSSFVDWLVTKGFDFIYSKHSQNNSAFYLANELGLQHISLTLLKRVDQLPFAENNQLRLLCSYLRRESGLEKYFKFKSLIPIDAQFYKGRHANNIVKLILEKCKSMTNESLNSALRIAIKIHRPFDEINLILQRVSNLQHDPVSGESVLQNFTSTCIDFNKWKIEEGMKIVRELVRKGADINERQDNGETIALKWFCTYGRLEMLQLLQDCRADFNERVNLSGDSFLHLISRYGKEAGMIDLLAKEGYDLNITNSKQETPLQLAIAYGNICAVRDLIKFGEKVNDIDDDGKPPLRLACEMGEAEVAEELIKFGADLNYIDEDGKNLLHLALKTRWNFKPMVEILIKYGVDVNAKDYLGKTPLHRAKNVLLIKTLINAGAFVDVLDDECCTPLYWAMSERSDLMEELLMCGADMLDPKVLQRAKDRFQNSSANQIGTFQYMMEHLIKMTAAGLLNEVPGVNSKSEEQLQEYFKKCQAEVELLKCFFIDESNSLYTLLCKNRNRVCAYVDNKTLKNLVEGEVIFRNFPNYFVLIMGCYNEAVARKPLLGKATCALKKIIKVSLPDLCIDQIIMYLGNAYLMRLIEIDENVNFINFKSCEIL